MSVMLKVSSQPWRCQCGANVLTRNSDETYICNGCQRTYAGPGYVEPTPVATPTDHTKVIAEAAREYVRALNTWMTGTQPYPAAAEEALIAAVEAEHTEKEEA